MNLADISQTISYCLPLLCKQWADALVRHLILCGGYYIQWKSSPFLTFFASPGHGKAFQIYIGKTINDSVTYKYGNIPFAAQVERELGVSFRTSPDSIIYVRLTIRAGSRLLIEKLRALLNPLAIIRTVDSHKIHRYSSLISRLQLGINC